MNRWLILATLAFSGGLAAAAQPPTPSPAVGERITLAARPSNGPVIMLPRPRNGDPDSPDFEANCQLTTPFELTVLGILADPGAASIIVARYRTASQDQGFLRCRDGGVLLVNREDWNTLKAAEAALARERAEQDRRREAVRAIIRRSRPTEER